MNFPCAINGRCSSLSKTNDGPYSLFFPGIFQLFIFFYKGENFMGNSVQSLVGNFLAGLRLRHLLFLTKSCIGAVQWRRRRKKNIQGKICPNITFLVFEHEVSQAASPGGKILTTCIHKPYVDMLQLYTHTYTGFVFWGQKKENEIC